MAEENFSWQKIGDGYATLVKSLIEETRLKTSKKQGFFENNRAHYKMKPGALL